MFCKYCGAEIIEGSKFCQICGKKLEGIEYNTPVTEEVVQEVVPAAEEAVQEAAPAAEETVQEVVPAAEETVQAAAPAVEEAVQAAATMQSEVQQTQYVPPVQSQPAYQQPQQTAAYQQAYDNTAQTRAAEPVYQQPQTAQTQYVPPVQQAAAATAAEPAKKKSKVGLIIGLAAGGTALIVLLLLLFLLIIPAIRNGQKVSIDFRDYVKAEFYGYDTIGYADGDIDRDRFIEDYGEKIKYTKDYQGLADDPADMILYYVYGYMDYDYGKLSNGDQADFVLYVDPEIEEIFKVEIVDKDEYSSDGSIIVPVTVEGLEEAEIFDPFENIEITVEGISPFGYIDYNFNNSPEPSRDNYYAFSADKYYELANGDVVTISLDEWYAEDYFLSTYGMLPSRTTYDYTVEGLPEYLTSTSQITSADEEYLKTVCDKIYKEEYLANNSESISNNSFGLSEMILKVAVSPNEYSSRNNTLYLVYFENDTVSDPNGAAAPQDFTVYSVISFNNVYIEDGAIVVDEDNWNDMYNYYSMDIGDWTISGSYGFGSLEDARAKVLDGDSNYTYEELMVN